MGLVLTQELGWVQLKSGNWIELLSSKYFSMCSYLHHRHLARVGIYRAVERTLNQIEIQDSGVASGSLIDAQQPLHRAVAQPRVASQ